MIPYGHLIGKKIGLAYKRETVLTVFDRLSLDSQHIEKRRRALVRKRKSKKEKRNDFSCVFKKNYSKYSNDNRFAPDFQIRSNLIDLCISTFVQTHINTLHTHTYARAHLFIYTPPTTDNSTHPPTFNIRFVLD